MTYAPALPTMQVVETPFCLRDSTRTKVWTRERLAATLATRPAGSEELQVNLQHRAIVTLLIAPALCPADVAAFNFATMYAVCFRAGPPASGS